MKVKVSFTVDIDPEAWALNYGIKNAEIREDVKRFAEDAVLDQFQACGLLRKV